MRRFFGLAAGGVAILVAVACSSSKPAEVKPGEAPFRTTGTIKDIMDSVVDPNADYLWDAVATTISKAGTDEKMPRTDEDWKQARRHAIALIEATNLLVIEGRKVANAGEKSENPEVELGPEEIQKLLDGDRNSWVMHAHGLHDAAMVALKAIESKNVQGLLDAGEGIDEACENCHKQYWYPNENQPANKKS